MIRRLQYRISVTTAVKSSIPHVLITNTTDGECQASTVYGNTETTTMRVSRTLLVSLAREATLRSSTAHSKINDSTNENMAAVASSVTEVATVVAAASPAKESGPTLSQTTVPGTAAATVSEQAGAPVKQRKMLALRRVFLMKVEDPARWWGADYEARLLELIQKHMEQFRYFAWVVVRPYGSTSSALATAIFFMQYVKQTGRAAEFFEYDFKCKCASHEKFAYKDSDAMRAHVFATGVLADSRVIMAGPHERGSYVSYCDGRAKNGGRKPKRRERTGPRLRRAKRQRQEIPTAVALPSAKAP